VAVGVKVQPTPENLRSQEVTMLLKTIVTAMRRMTMEAKA